MPIKTLENLFNLAEREKASRLVIGKINKDYGCHLEYNDKEASYLRLPKRLEGDLADNLRQLLNIGPNDLSKGRYCKLRSKKYKLNFRLSIIPTKQGEKIVITPIYDKLNLLSINKLGMQKSEKEALLKALSKKSGLIIITSKERQGRSTTLHSCLQALDRDKNLVYLMEEYPEINIPGVIALKNTKGNWERALRHDSNIIAAEIEKGEESKTLTEAVKTAATGRLVIVSLPAVNSLEALYKLLSLNLPIRQSYKHLNLILFQSLVTLKTKKASQREKIGVFEKIEMNTYLEKYIGENKNKIRNKTFWQTIRDIAIKNGYTPISNDIKKKQETGIISEIL